MYEAARNLPWQPEGVSIVQSVDDEIQVDVEIVISVVVLLPDPLQFRTDVLCALLERSRSVESFSLVGIEVDHGFDDIQTIRSNGLVEGERPQAADYISRFTHCPKRVSFAQRPI
jgi:hypothetical protein